MSEYSIPYGKSELSFHIPDERKVDCIAPLEAPAAADPRRAVVQALETPLGASRVQDFKGVMSAAIAVNDKTRPVPHQLLLPPLLERLEMLGLEPASIQLLIATGTHQPMQPEEFEQILPAEIMARYPVFSHNARDEANLVHLGQTPHGTPVWINRRYIEADLRITIGNIEPHQFEGFSGGVKSAAIGLAGDATINHNHALMIDPMSQLGVFEENPARQDVEEIGKRIGVHFCLNAILNTHKEIVHALAGDPYLVLQHGIPLARRFCQVAVDAPYDFMVVAPGGHPKDINLYQSQKALYHANQVMRTGGTVILAAACPDGTGSPSYEEWVIGMKSYTEVFERFKREGFRIGPHKAFQIARDASKVHLLFLSQMSPDFTRSLLIDPVSDLQQAVNLVLSQLPLEARIAIMPRATSTIPYLK